MLDGILASCVVVPLVILMAAVLKREVETKVRQSRRQWFDSHKHSVLIEISMAGDLNKCLKAQLSQLKIPVANRVPMRLRQMAAMLNHLMTPMIVDRGCGLSMKERSQS